MSWFGDGAAVCTCPTNCYMAAAVVCPLGRKIDRWERLRVCGISRGNCCRAVKLRGVWWWYV